MSEQEGKVMKNKKTLLMKYDIPVNHLSFEYVEKCNDGKELEKIVKILRSGEEGYFPQLTECAEARLKQIAPESHLLWTQQPLLNKSTLEAEAWKKVAGEMEEWTSEMKNRDLALQDSRSSKIDLPEVRSAKNTMLQENEENKEKVKPARCRDYADWDKYDVEKELLKMELEEERRKEQIAKAKKQQEKEKMKKEKREEQRATDQTKNLSAVEKEFLATQEKDRGNEFYRAGDYEEAVKCYSNSITLSPAPTAYNNRAMAQLKLQRYGEVIEDCNLVLKAEPLNVKALHRRGCAYQGKNSFKQAYEDFLRITTLEPENQAAKSLAEQMRRKTEAPAKTVRLSIGEGSSGTKVPLRRPPVQVNKWGLPKIMCTCSGTPDWALRKPPKCRTCQKIKEEREAKRLEEARRAEEKGSGDTVTTEKVEPPPAEQPESSNTCDVNRLGISNLKIGEVDNVNSSVADNVNVSADRVDNVKVGVDAAEVETTKTFVPSDTKTVQDSNKHIKEKCPAASEKHTKVQVANKYKNPVKDDPTERPPAEISTVAPAATTPFEFVKEWQSLRKSSDLQAHAEVLRSVPPSALPSVIGNKLDGPMLSTMLTCLERHFAPELLLEYLNSIMQLPRFNIVSMFLDPPQKQAMRRLLQNLEGAGYRPSGAMWQAYAC